MARELYLRRVRMKYIYGEPTLDDIGEHTPMRPGSQRQYDGRMPADLLRSVRPTIRHYSPAMLLSEAIKKAGRK